MQYECIMGSSLSSPIAELVMERLEETCLKQLKYPPSFYFRYDDDIITTYPEEHVHDALHKFNSWYPNIQFTIELEENNEKGFLDIKLF